MDKSAENNWKKNGFLVLCMIAGQKLTWKKSLLILFNV